MEHQLIIIRYGEIGLKSKTTRKYFEKKLIKNIKNAFKKEKISNMIKIQMGRIYVYTNEINIAVKVLQKIFGIISVSPAVETKSNIDLIAEKAVEILKEKIKEKQSFALRVTRDGKHEYTSQDVAVYVGDAIVKNTKAKVNLTKPDHTLYIEIRGKNAFLFEEKIPCQGGLPLGTQGTVLAIVEKQETILAAWYLMRRGCNIVFIVTNKTIEKTLKNFLKKWFVEPQIFFIKSNKKIKEIILEKQCEAIVTNHTINDNNFINDTKQLKKQFKLPVLQPLITMNHDEIQKKSREIGLLR